MKITKSDLRKIIREEIEKEYKLQIDESLKDKIAAAALFGATLLAPSGAKAAPVVNKASSYNIAPQTNINSNKLIVLNIDIKIKNDKLKNEDMYKTLSDLVINKYNNLQNLSSASYLEEDRADLNNINNKKYNRIIVNIENDFNIQDSDGIEINANGAKIFYEINDSTKELTPLGIQYNNGIIEGFNTAGFSKIGHLIKK